MLSFTIRFANPFGTQFYNRVLIWNHVKQNKTATQNKKTEDLRLFAYLSPPFLLIKFIHTTSGNEIKFNCQETIVSHRAFKSTATLDDD